MSASFTTMMLMFDYGCEKHYGKPKKHSNRYSDMTADDIKAMRERVERAMKANGMRV